MELGRHLAEIKSVLHELIQWKFIDRDEDSDMTVSITASGITRLGLKEKVYGLTRISAGSEGHRRALMGKPRLRRIILITRPQMKSIPFLV